jgi:hypothetical protein
MLFSVLVIRQVHQPNYHRKKYYAARETLNPVELALHTAGAQQHI